MEYWKNGDIPWFTPQELTKLESNSVKDSKRKITQKGLDESGANMIPENNILITTRATIGNCVINENKAATNQGFLNLIVNKNHNNKFLMYSIRFNKRRLRQYSQGTTFLEISRTNFGKIKIPCPKDIREEEKIASILSNIDELIQKQQEVITQTQKLKKGQMQKLLLQGIGHTQFKKVKWYFGTQIEIPKDWEVRTLGSLVTLLTNGFVGQATVHYTESENGVLYVQGYNIKENNFNFHGIKRVSQEFDEQNKKSRLQSGDLLTIQTGNVGTTAIVPDELVGSNCHALIISRLKREIADPEFYSQYFNSHHCKTMFKMIEIGTSLKHLNGSDMKKLQFLRPPLPEQKKIASILSNLDLLIQQENQYKEKLQKIKRGLMQQLLTGNRRVKV